MAVFSQDECFRGQGILSQRFGAISGKLPEKIEMVSLNGNNYVNCVLLLLLLLFLLLLLLLLLLLKYIKR